MGYFYDPEIILGEKFATKICILSFTKNESLKMKWSITTKDFLYLIHVGSNKIGCGYMAGNRSRFLKH